MGNPANCVRVGGYDAAGGGVAVVGNYAYLVYQGIARSGLLVIDVSDPAKCVRAGGDTTLLPAHRVAVAGPYAYVGWGGFLSCGFAGHRRGAPRPSAWNSAAMTLGLRAAWGWHSREATFTWRLGAQACG